jgi:hypothetical protein
MLDDIGVIVQQKGDESRGVQIPGMDTAGGQDGDDTTAAPSKVKGTAMQVIYSDDEVLSDDDAPLQRRLRSIYSARLVVGGPTLVEPQVPEVTMLGASSGITPAAVDTTTVKKATADKKVTDAATAKKVVDDIVAEAAKAAADREATDAAVAKKVIDDVVAAVVKAVTYKEATDAAATKKAAYNVALTKGVPEETTRDQQILAPKQLRQWGPIGILCQADPLHLPNGRSRAPGGLGYSTIP